MFKRFFSVLCITCVIFVISACSNNNNAEIAGKWVPTTITINGETLKYSDIETDEKQFEINFSENGKCSATLAGISDDCDFTFSGTSVDIEINGEKHKLSYDNGTLTLSLNYSSETTVITFSKVI